MKKILLLLFLIPILSKGQNPVEKYMPHAFYQTVSYPNLSASLPLKLNAAKQITAAKILVGDVDTSLSVNGIIGYPRFWKMRDSLLGIIAGMGGGGGSPGGVSGNVQWNNAGAFAGFGTTNGTYLNIPGGVSAAGARNYTGTTIGMQIVGGEGAIDAYDAGAAVYKPIHYYSTIHRFYYNLSEVARINNNGLGIGLASSGPWLHIAAGEAARAPIRLTTGTALTTPEDGAIEYHSSHLYFTIGSTRYQLDQQGGGGGVTSITGTANQVLANGNSGTSETGAVTLTLPQSIGTASTPQFGALGLGAAASGSTYLNLPASSSSISSLRIPTGSQPTSPVNGDMFGAGTGELRWYNGVESKKLDNGFNLQADSDANQTLAKGFFFMLLDAVITANRTISFPASQTGDEVILWVNHGTAFNWSIAGGFTAVNSSGGSITTLTDNTVYRFLCIGTNFWLRVN